jgi:hypothetical protein
MWEREGVLDGDIPVHTHDYRDVDFWIDPSDLADLISVLFPHGIGDTPTINEGRALVVLMIYSALETVARDVGLQQRGNESVIRSFDGSLEIEKHQPKLWSSLVELRETRNLIAHSGGVVTQRYKRVVPASNYEVGERCQVTDADIQRFSNASRQLVRLLLERHDEA